MHKLLKFPLTSIVVINWNNSEDTITCIESLQNIDYPNYHVLVLDNGSDDDSLIKLTEITKNLSKVTVFETGDNLGFSGGVNYGIEKSLNMKADYIWLLNNDTEVDCNCLTNLVEAMEKNPDVAIAGSQILLSSERNIIWHAGATIGKHTGQPQHLGMGANINDQTYSNNKFVDYVTGASLMIRQNSIKDVGVMDDRFYLYYEEADLCYRVKKKGFKILYVADSKLWHKVAASSTGYHTRVYYEVRNRLLFTFKHYPSQFFLVFKHLIVQELIKPLLNRNLKVAKSALFGFIDFFTLRFGRLKHKL